MLSLQIFVSLGLVYKNCILNFVSQLYLLLSSARVLSWDTTLKKAVVGVMQARKQGCFTFSIAFSFVQKES